MAFVSRMRKLNWAPARPDEVSYSAQEVVGLKRVASVGVPVARPSALAKMMWEEGVPQATGESPREEAVALLQVAAEVEHALLVQYLYSAYSLNTNVDQASDAQGQIIEVAKQEMAHLITVQNLLLALGAKVDLNRENFPADPADYPFPVSLEPLSSDSLAKYVTAESPTTDQVPDADKNDVIAIAKQADKAVSGTASKVNHVGIIYAKIYWLFQEHDAAQGPWILPADVIQCFVTKFGAGFHLADVDFADPAVVGNFAATKQEWGGDNLMHVDAGTPRGNALAAINWITAQGEGPNKSNVTQTHFQAFLKLYRLFNSLPPNAVLDVPVNPSTKTPAGGSTSPNAITDPVSLLLAQLLNVRYQMLLLDIVLALSLDRSKEGALRTTIVRTWAVGSEMASFLSPIAMGLATKKRTPVGGEKPTLAGAPFELEEIPSTMCDQWKQQRELSARSNALAANLKALLHPGDSDAGIVDSIVAFDLQRQPVINQKIAETCGG